MCTLCGWESAVLPQPPVYTRTDVLGLSFTAAKANFSDRKRFCSGENSGNSYNNILYFKINSLWNLFCVEALIR